jgi:hypothetical protein
VIWVVQPAAQKYVAFRPFKSVARLRHPDPTRGADRASSRTRDGMRWTRGRQARCVFAGRFSVSEHWPRKTNGAQAYGKTVWSRHPLLVPSYAEAASTRPSLISRKSGDDGGKTNSSPGRARHKPSSHCAGNAGVFRLYLYARVRFFAHGLHTRPRVQRAPGIPCSLQF